jgi:hypothetical protein
MEQKAQSKFAIRVLSITFLLQKKAEGLSNVVMGLDSLLQERKRPRISHISIWLHLAKIQEIKSISEPPLPKEIYTIWQKLSLDTFRKKLLFSFGEIALHPHLALTPPTVRTSITLSISHFR